MRAVVGLSGRTRQIGGTKWNFARAGKTSADALRYDYTLRDHLGNTRVTFTDKNNNGKIDMSTNASTNEVLQENHYYPFGLTLRGPWIDGEGETTKYQYNGKELNNDFGMGWTDYMARWYDAAAARWWVTDPISDFQNSPYGYCLNNPVYFTDPYGMSPDSIKRDKSSPDPDMYMGNKAFDEVVVSARRTRRESTPFTFAPTGIVEQLNEWVRQTQERLNGWTIYMQSEASVSVGAQSKSGKNNIYGWGWDIALFSAEVLGFESAIEIPIGTLQPIPPKVKKSGMLIKDHCKVKQKFAAEALGLEVGTEKDFTAFLSGGGSEPGDYKPITVKYKGFGSETTSEGKQDFSFSIDRSIALILGAEIRVKIGIKNY